MTRLFRDIAVPVLSLSLIFSGGCAIADEGEEEAKYVEAQTGTFPQSRSQQSASADQKPPELSIETPQCKGACTNSRQCAEWCDPEYYCNMQYVHYGWCNPRN